MLPLLLTSLPWTLEVLPSKAVADDLKHLFPQGTTTVLRKVGATGPYPVSGTDHAILAFSTRYLLLVPYALVTKLLDFNDEKQP